MEPDYLLVQMGDLVDVRCIVTGDPEPTVEWSDSRGTLPSDADVYDGILRFHMSRRDQAGEYRCRASSSIGQAHATVVIEGTIHCRGVCRGRLGCP